MQAKVVDQFYLKKHTVQKFPPKLNLLCPSRVDQQIFFGQVVFRRAKSCETYWSGLIQCWCKHLVQFRLKSLSPYFAYLQCVSGRSSAGWIDSGVGCRCQTWLKCFCKSTSVVWDNSAVRGKSGLDTVNHLCCYVMLCH